MNLYFGLLFAPSGYPAIAPFNKIREGVIPEFKVTQALNVRNGQRAVTTPPPHLVSEFESATIPMPKGKKNITYVRLAQFEQKQMVVKGETDEETTAMMN